MPDFDSSERESNNREFDRLMTMQEISYNRMLRQMALSTVVHSQLPLSTQDSVNVAGPLSSMENQDTENLENQSLRDMRDMDDLLGAADFYGIRDPERIPADSLLGLVEQKRKTYLDSGTGQKQTLPSQLSHFIAGAAPVSAVIQAIAPDIDRGNATLLLASTVPQEWLFAAENLAAHVPFFGDAIARSQTARSANRWFGKLHEAALKGLPDDQRAKAKGVVGAISYAIPAAASWEVAGLLGLAPKTAVEGAKLLPIGRAALRGLISQVAIDDPTKPVNEQIVDAGMAAAFGGATAVEGVIGRTLAGTGVGGLIGSISSGGDPRATLLGAAAGGTAFALGPTLLRNTQRSFPSARFGGDETVIFGGHIPYEPARIGPPEPLRLGPGSRLPGAPEPPIIGEGPVGPSPLRLTSGAPEPGPLPEHLEERGVEESLNAADFSLLSGSLHEFEEGSLVRQTPEVVRNMIRKLVGERRSARRLAEIDPLTGAGNVAAWNRARGAIEADPNMSVIAIDLDNMKAANDFNGHEFGNQAIQLVKQATDDAAQFYGIPNRVFRTGGDEFLVAVPTEHRETFAKLAEQLYGLTDVEGYPLKITTGVGSTFDEADHNLLAAKQGRVATPFRKLTPKAAASEAAALTKHSDIIGSPALPEIASAAKMDDADVARALVASRPGQIGVVQNIGDVDKTVRRILQDQMPNGVGPQDFRVVQRSGISVAAFRGSPNNPADLGIGGARFFSPHEDVAQLYAGPTGTVIQEQLNFNRPQRAENWQEAKVQLGLPRSTTMEDLIAASRASGYDGLIFRKASANRAGPNRLDTEFADLGVSVPKQTDLLISSGQPISNQMVKDYEQHGIFSGQLASTSDGQKVVVRSIDADGNAAIVPIHSTDPPTLAPVHTLLPMNESELPLDMPGLYGNFATFAQARLDVQSFEAGIAPLNLYSQEASKLIPGLLDEFVHASSAGDSYYGTAAKHLIQQKHIEALRDLAPAEDKAVLSSVKESYRNLKAKTKPVEPTLDDLAAARGMHIEPGSNGGLTLVDDVSAGDLKVPVEDEAAAREFLRGFQRGEIDDAPVTPFPIEVIETPADYSETRGHEVGEWNSTDHEVAGLKLLVDNFDNGVYDYYEADRLPEIPGVGGSTPPPPPPPPPGNLPGFPEPPRYPVGPIAQPPSHGAQHLEAAQRYPRAYNTFLQRSHDIVTKLFRDSRTFAIMLDNNAEALGITEGQYYKYVSDLENSSVRKANQANSWINRAFDLMGDVSNRHMRDGSFFAVANAPARLRLAEANRVGLSQKELDAVENWNNLMHTFRDEVAIKIFPEMGNVEDYVSHMRSFEQALPGDMYRAPGEAKWGPEKRRGNVEGLDLEKDMSVIIPRYFDGFFKVAEMEQPYQALKNHLKDPRVPEVIRAALTDWADARMWGLDPTHDVLAEGTRFALDMAARTVGMRATMNDVMKIYQGSFGLGYRVALGGQLQPIIRDLPQGLIGGMQLGLDRTTPTLLRILRDPAYRAAVANRAMEAGWVQAGHAQAVDADMASSAEFNRPQAKQIFGEGVAQRREGLAQAHDIVQDKLLKPLGLRGGISGTWADFLGPYGMVNDGTRMWLGESGYQSALQAIGKHWNALQALPEGSRKGIYEQILDDARVARYQGAIQRQFTRLLQTDGPEAAARFFGNEVANSQNRHGMSAHPSAFRKMGPVTGRMAMYFNSFNSQTLAGIAQILADPSISTGNKMGYLSQVGALQFLFAAATAYTGWNVMKASLQGLATVPGNGIFKIINTYQAANAYLREHMMGVNLTPEQQAIVASKSTDFGSTPFTLDPFRSSLNPFQGAFREVSGLSESIPFGTEATIRNLVTGQRGDPEIDRLGEGYYPQIVVQPYLQNGEVPPPEARPRLNSAGGLVVGGGAQ